MPRDDTRDLARFYEAELAEHGDGARAVGWGSFSQLTCFAQLARVDGLTPGARVLDVGCGLGAFRRFLDNRGVVVDYTGYDICAPYIERAAADLPGGRFEVRDVVADPPETRFDVVVASGVLNLMMRDHDDWVRAMIAAMYAATDHALAFNVLSAAYIDAHPHLHHPDYFYAYPPAILALCLEHTPRVTLDHSEQGTMFTVYLYRDARSSLARLIDLHRPGPTWSEAHEAVVQHCIDHGTPARALEYLRALPETVPVLDALGAVAHEMGDERGQLAYWKRAAELAPDDADLARRIELLEQWMD